MKKTGLFFGSFNPVHVGHLIIGEFMATQTDLDEVWMIVSPHNPLKKKNTLAPDYERLHLLYLATQDNDNLKPSDIEFNLPKPSFTVDTLAYLTEKYPENQFVLIMGGDNLETLHKWKNYEFLLEHFFIYVYNRPGYHIEKYIGHKNVRFFDAPLMSISSTYIRECLKSKRSVKYLVTEKVRHYLEDSMLYR